MKKIWIETWKVEPPDHYTISGRFGASIMFVAYSRILDRWMWIQPGGREEQIPEPPLIFVEEKWAREHPRTGGLPRENANRIRRTKCEQLFLF